MWMRPAWIPEIRRRTRRESNTGIRLEDRTTDLAGGTISSLLAQCQLEAVPLSPSINGVPPRARGSNLHPVF